MAKRISKMVEAFLIFTRNQRIINLWTKFKLKMAERISIRPGKDELGSLRKGTEYKGTFGINIVGYIDSAVSLGEAVRLCIKSIEKVQIPYRLRSLKKISREKETTFNQFVKDSTFCFNLIQVNPMGYANVFNELGVEFLFDKYNIGSWTWEISRFPTEWIDCFNYFNEIWVPSAFCLESIGGVAPIPVVKMPYAVSVDQMKNIDRSFFGLKKDSFIFLSIFDFNSYFERKNPFAVLRAFKEAFRPEEDVFLVYKCSHSRKYSGIKDQLINEARGLNVTFIDKYLHKEELNALMQLSDCYISLHRSEGFGLPLAEAMYLGKPVIGTGYSGNMDFMNNENSFPVHYSLVEIKEDIGPYKKGNVWAEPDINHASELMRLVYQEKEQAKKVGRSASKYIKSEFNYRVIGQKILERLQYILKERNITVPFQSAK